MENENKDIAKHLKTLVQLDIDAIHAYEQAIKEIDVVDIREQLRRFQQDHRNHVDNLSPFIRKLGYEPPEFKLDFKGYMIQGFTALRSQMGNEGALKAMKGNEQLTNSVYAKALSWELPPDVRAVVEKNREDERRHLQYIEEQIDTRGWERKHVA